MKVKNIQLIIMLIATLLTACNASDISLPPSTSDNHIAVKKFPTDSLPLASELGETKDTLVVALPMDIKTLNPLNPSSSWDVMLQAELFLPLVKYYSEQEKWVPILAEKLDWSADKTTLIMTLKKGYTWSDGERLTAEDVKFTYDLMADPRTGSQRLDYIKNMVPGWNPKIIDAQTLEWHFQHGYEYHKMMTDLSAPLVPKHILTDKDPTTLMTDSFNQNPITSGPWVVGEKQDNDHIKLIQNPNFNAPDTMRPRLKSVVFRIIPDAVTRTLELEQGNVDMSFSQPQEDVERWTTTHPEIKPYPRKYANVIYMAYGLTDLDDLRAKKNELKAGQDLNWTALKPHRIFGDAAVRRALAKAVNVQAIINQLDNTHKRLSVATTLVSPDFTAVTPSTAPTAYNPEQARQELAAAGWHDTDGNGILEKDGNEFTFVAYMPPNAQILQKSALMIQSDLHKIGVNMQPQNMDMSGIIARASSGEYEAVLFGDIATAENTKPGFWDPQMNGGASAYMNVQIRNLLEQVSHESDVTKSNALIQQIQNIYYADQPLLFLYWAHPTAMIHQRFNGMQTLELASPLTDLHNWWVDPTEVKYH